MGRPTQAAIDTAMAARDNFKSVAKAIRVLEDLRKQSKDGLALNKQPVADGLLRIAVAQAEAMQGILQELQDTYLIP